MLHISEIAELCIYAPFSTPSMSIHSRTILEVGRCSAKDLSTWLEEGNVAVYICHPCRIWDYMAME
jgi:hypothetical protein